MLRISRVLVAFSFALLPAGLPAQQVGPAHGSLVIVGGGAIDSTIMRAFLDLAGGVDAPIVVIPTAGDDTTYDAGWRGLGQLKALGATHLTVLHTRSRDTANSDGFLAPLRAATGVWIPGGRQWRLADVYLGTGVQRELDSLLARDGVIGGTSAGATIQGSYLVRGDTRNNTIMMGDHEVGFGFLREVAIDQHVLRRNRQFDLIAVVERHPDLLGIGLDEGTAIFVRGDEFEVRGPSYAAIYDHRRAARTGQPFLLLQPGDRFNLATREVVRPPRRNTR